MAYGLKASSGNPLNLNSIIVWEFEMKIDKHYD